MYSMCSPEPRTVKPALPTPYPIVQRTSDSGHWQGLTDANRPEVFKFFVNGNEIELEKPPERQRLTLKGARVAPVEECQLTCDGYNHTFNSSCADYRS